MYFSFGSHFKLQCTAYTAYAAIAGKLHVFTVILSSCLHMIIGLTVLFNTVTQIMFVFMSGNNLDLDF